MTPAGGVFLIVLGVLILAGPSKQRQYPFDKASAAAEQPTIREWPRSMTLMSASCLRAQRDSSHAGAMVRSQPDLMDVAESEQIRALGT